MVDKKVYVLDTSAIFCLKDDASGADKVEKILQSQDTVYASFMTYMEYLYITMIKYGDERAREAYLRLTMLPIQVVESDEELRYLAAELKAKYNISLADAWIAATAKRLDAILIHKDPEFEALADVIKCINLPYKKGN